MKTALITGASEGIGYEFAKIFVQNGNRVIMVARNESRLKEVATELQGAQVDIRYYAKDLSIPDNAYFIYEDLKSKNIGIDYLINNAGFGINGEYTDIDWQRELEMFHLNMISLAYFTKVYARDMKQNGFGRILNLGSTGSFQPGPYMAGYCASKAFVLSLSEAVNFELKGTGVRVSTLCPGVTDSKFHAVAKTEKTLMSRLLSHASPEEVARYGYKIMMKGKPSGIQGMLNNLMVFSNRLAPRTLSVYFAAKLLKAQN